VSREIARHGGRDRYRASEADFEAWSRRADQSPVAWRRDTGYDGSRQKLKLDWSPEQISGWLKGKFPDDETMRVSHEVIYRSLFIQARGCSRRS